jgi:hypothetical protein
MGSGGPERQDPGHAEPGDAVGSQSAARDRDPVRGAINNGLTREEIREFFMQITIYCGVPAAVDSFRIANRVFADMGEKS